MSQRTPVRAVLSESGETDVKRPAGRRVVPPLSAANARDGATNDANATAEGFVFGETSVLRIMQELQEGSFVLLAEDGDEASSISLIAAPEFVTTEQIEFLNAHAVRSHVALQAPLYKEIYEALHKVTIDNCSASLPALSVSFSGSSPSATNLSHLASTVNALARPNASSQLNHPGVMPLKCAREGGVLQRAGATEAAVELCRLAGLPAVGLQATLCVSGQVQLREFAKQWGLQFSSTADLVAFQRRRSKLVERSAPPAAMPTRYGTFTAHVYRSLVDGLEHIALVKAADSLQNLKPFQGVDKPALVRVHSECCTGDIFGSLRCDCGPQLEAGLQAIERDGWGVLLYLRGQEGRGIGLGAKIHAYSLQERGLDTLDANLELGLPVDSREYGTGAQILVDLGIRDMRLISNNPKKFTGLAGFGLRIVNREPSLTMPNKENIEYLRTKVERMGHMLDLDASGWTDNGVSPPINGADSQSPESGDSS